MRITPKGIMVHSTGCNNPNLKRYVQPSINDANYKTLIS
nr:MAG TPA: PGRP recognition protein [Caudoviricetes sp.]